jgi:hypothetical protein
VVTALRCSRWGLRPQTPAHGCVAVAAASFTVTSHALAQPSAPGKDPVRLSWVRAAGADACPTERRIAAQVAERLGRNPFSVDAAQSIEAYVARSERGWHAEIHVRGRDGTRVGSRDLTSEAADCAGIEAAAVLAIVLAIDPDALAAGPPRPPAPSEGSPPPSAPRAFAPPPPDVPPPLPAWVPPEPPTPPAERQGLGPGASTIALRVGTGLGLLPRVGAALSLAGHVGVARSVQISAEALWLPEMAATDPRISFGLAAGALGACVRALQRGRVDLAACASLWGGALHAVVYTLIPVDPGERPWAAAEASPLLRIRLVDHLHLDLGVHVIVPLVRPAFIIRGVKDPLFQEPVVTLAPLAGVGAHFP